jgi:hypothetical protein
MSISDAVVKAVDNCLAEFAGKCSPSVSFAAAWEMLRQGEITFLFDGKSVIIFPVKPALWSAVAKRKQHIEIVEKLGPLRHLRNSKKVKALEHEQPDTFAGLPLCFLR